MPINNTSQVSEEIKNTEGMEDAESENNTNEDIVEKQEDSYIAPKPKCIYETSHGVCFTTKAFKPTPLDYYDCSGGWTTYGKERTPVQKFRDIGINHCYERKDYWAGAKVQCSEWGYKLPDAYELGSLAADIYNANISNEIDVTSYLPNGYSPNEKPKQLLSFSTANGSVSLWENLEKNNISAFERHFGYRETSRRSQVKENDYFYTLVACVYDPKGRATSSYKEYAKSLEKKAAPATKPTVNTKEEAPASVPTEEKKNTDKTNVESVEDDLF